MKNIDNRVREFLFPKRIVDFSKTVVNPENLLKEKELQIATCEDNLTYFNCGDFIILDFGEEYYGGIRILTKNCIDDNEENKPCTVRIRFGESLTETCINVGEKGATNDHAVRDMNVVLGSHSDMEFGNTGFRFVRIDFLTPGVYTKIKNIVAVYVHRELNQLGYFKCNDENVNEIYRVATRTINLCMQSMLWDGIKRDKLVWIGDMHPEMMSIRCLYGDDYCIEQGLDHVVNQFKLPVFINDKPSYSMWFVIILHDWYIQNKNTEFVKKHLTYIDDLFKVLDKLVDAEGNMHFDGYFFDWPSHDTSFSDAGGTQNSINGVKSIFVMSLTRAIKLFEIFGKDTTLLIALKNRLLSHEEGPSTNKQALAFDVLSGQKELDQDCYNKLVAGGAKGLSTFMSYYILKVVAKKDVKAALDIMRAYFGGMISRGATTFWEDFNIDWLEDTGRIDEFPKEGQKDIHGDKGAYCYEGFRHSFCHAWSTGPIPFLTEDILGIKVLEPGCKKVSICPNLGDLEYAEGAYPTPFGLIKVNCKKIDGKVNVQIDKPAEIEIVE